MDDFFQDVADFAPAPPVSKIGTSNLTFDGLLQEPGLKVFEDGGAAGCGGKLWPAGELLSKYLIRKGLGGAKHIVELGSGTGLVGCVYIYFSLSFGNS